MNNVTVTVVASEGSGCCSLGLIVIIIVILFVVLTVLLNWFFCTIFFKLMKRQEEKEEHEKETIDRHQGPPVVHFAYPVPDPTIKLEHDDKYAEKAQLTIDISAMEL